MNEYNVSVGDRVFLIKQPSLKGEVVAIDSNLPNLTTCEVLWCGYHNIDVQWTNKLEVLDNENIP